MLFIKDLRKYIKMRKLLIKCNQFLFNRSG